ncbi:MAG: HD domain-containing protein [Chromatiales bacterium]|jgi:response regulator RpfG family c-di-GMP phosphodiesterase
MRLVLHYVAMMVIIPIYGIQVCPFIEGLSPLAVFATIDSLLLLALLLRIPLRTRLVDQRPLAGQVWRIFKLDLGLLMGVGLLLSLYNMAVYDFPLVSGLKVLVGIVAMGLFASADSALQRERDIAAQVKANNLLLEVSNDFFPLTSKLALFAGAYVLLMVGVFALLVIKDLDWLVSIGDSVPLKDARISILKEFGFVFLVVLLEALNIIPSFTRNLNLFLRNENQALEQVSSGQYDARVPVSSNDEFGIMAVHTNEMIKRIRQRTEELNRTRDVTILTLASLAETRDNETGAHILRTQRYVKALAQQLSDHPRFADMLNAETIELLYKSAPLHDIGKVGIPDAILLKPGKLTDDEFEIMKTHTSIGANALAVTEQQLGSNSFLSLAREITLTHHEKWDGSGYPAGLKGEDIPVSGRLMALADVYDALISKRVYKPAFSHEQAMEIIQQGRGSHFDPAVVDALLAIEAQFREIAVEYSDEVHG